ncbi:transketolase C-terminal domain-containing protein [Streptomyces sp. NPDC058657]|uniref:transketolase C-terminal domain-containing protein n=1 Tax=unclassified Streptomyces TaxID=2593676 RepID=UPI00365D7D26
MSGDCARGGRVDASAEGRIHEGDSVQRTVVDPRWIVPVPAALVELCLGHSLVATVEDGGRSGGAGAAIAQTLADAGARARLRR